MDTTTDKLNTAEASSYLLFNFDTDFSADVNTGSSGRTYFFIQLSQSIGNPEPTVFEYEATIPPNSNISVQIECVDGLCSYSEKILPESEQPTDVILGTPQDTPLIGNIQRSDSDLLYHIQVENLSFLPSENCGFGYGQGLNPLEWGTDTLLATQDSLSYDPITSDPQFSVESTDLKSSPEAISLFLSEVNASLMLISGEIETSQLPGLLTETIAALDLTSICQTVDSLL